MDEDRVGTSDKNDPLGGIIVTNETLMTAIEELRKTVEAKLGEIDKKLTQNLTAKGVNTKPGMDSDLVASIANTSISTATVVSNISSSIATVMNTIDEERAEAARRTTDTLMRLQRITDMATQMLTKKTTKKAAATGPSDDVVSIATDQTAVVPKKAPAVQIYFKINYAQEVINGQIGKLHDIVNPYTKQNLTLYEYASSAHTAKIAKLKSPLERAAFIASKIFTELTQPDKAAIKSLQNSGYEVLSSATIPLAPPKAATKTPLRAAVKSTTLAKKTVHPPVVSDNDDDDNNSVSESDEGDEIALPPPKATSTQSIDKSKSAPIVTKHKPRTPTKVPSDNESSEDNSDDGDD